MQIDSRASLQSLNTFAIDATAHSLVEVHTVADIRQCVEVADRDLWVLGGGSNILLTGFVDRFVLLNNIKGIEIDNDRDDSVVVKVGAGENWHSLVSWAVTAGYGGIENLALIPGKVGAAPIQNIGAYGVELGDVFVGLGAVDLSSGTFVEMNLDACEFGYRSSIFKSRLQGQYCIAHIWLKLMKAPHVVQTSYGAIQSVLDRSSRDQPTIEDIFDTVVAIRSAKLPDPAVLPNSGSFFKNPLIDKEHFQDIAARFERVVHFPGPDGQVKVPAGWLIEQCGWKGKRVGNVGCYEKQALVLVNYGGATGAELLAHARTVQKSVFDTFGIRLEPEVTVI